MKKILLILLCLPMIGFGQNDCGEKPRKPFSNSGRDYKEYKIKLSEWEKCKNESQNKIFNKYKFIFISDIVYQNGQKDVYKLRYYAMEELKKYGFTVYLQESIPEELKNNICVALRLGISHNAPNEWVTASSTIQFSDCQNNIIYTKQSGSSLMIEFAPAKSLKSAVETAIKKSFKGYLHNYNPKLNKYGGLKAISAEASESYEEEIRKYLDENNLSPIEGIYDYASTDGSEYRIAIRKEGFKYLATIIESKSVLFGVKDIKATFEPTAAEGFFTLKWTMGDAEKVEKTIATLENNAIIEFTLPGSDNKTFLYKLYPKINSNFSSRNKGDSWNGNGSGIIISKSGYIITNHHVIDNANDIEVEFILDDEVQKFNAEVIQSDKVNDLAIIKIVDVNFDGVEELPYNFKTRSSDVGTKVYAFGYPMALSIMGKEIKVTDGIISSKTGFGGDITTYQISAPIQGGNSGGPLFDDKGNFIGINSAGIRKDVADNVGYSIKTSYVLNLIDILPKSINLPSNKKLASLSLIEQIKEITKYVVLIKVK